MSYRFETFQDILKEHDLDCTEQDLKYAGTILQIFNSSNPEKLPIDRTNPVILNWLGLYYELEEQEYKAVHYYQMGVKQGSIECMECLGTYYENKEEYETMKIYYEMGAKSGNLKCIQLLADYYLGERNYPQMVKYLKLGIVANSIESMLSLGKYYQNIKNYSEMKLCYLDGIERLSSSDAMYELGNYYYKKEKDYPNAIKYFLLGVEKFNLNCVNQLALHYMNVENDYLQAKKYYLMSLTFSEQDISTNLETINNLETICMDKFIFYKELLKIKSDNIVIINKIKELEQIESIQQYKIMLEIAKRKNNYKKCTICLGDDVLNVTPFCSHDICSECYNPNSRCYFNFCNC